MSDAICWPLFFHFAPLLGRGWGGEEVLPIVSFTYAPASVSSHSIGSVFILFSVVFRGGSWLL